MIDRDSAQAFSGPKRGLPHPHSTPTQSRSFQVCAAILGGRDGLHGCSLFFEALTSMSPTKAFPFTEVFSDVDFWG